MGLWQGRDLSHEKPSDHWEGRFLGVEIQLMFIDIIRLAVYHPIFEKNGQFYEEYSNKPHTRWKITTKWLDIIDGERVPEFSYFKTVGKILQTVCLPGIKHANSHSSQVSWIFLPIKTITSWWFEPL